MAMISDLGYIDDFSLDWTNNKTFPKLPKNQMNGKRFLNKRSVAYDFPASGLYFTYFAISLDSKLYFLSTNPKQLVIKYEIVKGLHSKIASSFIPNLHVKRKIFGLKIGNFFWIFGGIVQDSHDVSHAEYSEVQAQHKTSVWFPEREIWFDGPNIPDFFDKLNFCFTAINESYVAFIHVKVYQNAYVNHDTVEDYHYTGDIYFMNFWTNKWTLLKSDAVKDIAYCSATTYFTKDENM